ncbi:MAG TPA: GDCCVxC domain-containing (seleno)protein [Vicinamibacterales bacterium]|nr:GDCCVxC domain-containing (seleno)protein [Vicinamibacterales bacterium]
MQASVTCPRCAHVSSADMPTDRCVFFYECPGCKTVLRPKPGDCCVFCSYGDKRCPFVQDDIPCPDQSPAS